MRFLGTQPKGRGHCAFRHQGQHNERAIAVIDRCLSSLPSSRALGAEVVAEGRSFLPYRAAQLSLPLAYIASRRSLAGGKGDVLRSQPGPCERQGALGRAIREKRPAFSNDLGSERSGG